MSIMPPDAHTGTRVLIQQKRPVQYPGTLVSTFYDALGDECHSPGTWYYVQLDPLSAPVQGEYFIEFQSPDHHGGRWCVMNDRWDPVRSDLSFETASRVVALHNKG